MLFAIFIVVLILIIAVLAYRMLMKPDHVRIINKLGSGMWVVDKSSTGTGASFYVKFGPFTELANDSGKVQFTKYGQDKAFEYDSELDWSRAGNTLRIGQMRLELTAGANGRPPVIMYTNNVESIDSWTAPMKEVPSKKL